VQEVPAESPSGTTSQRERFERSQRTGWIELHATGDLTDPELGSRLEEWQSFYNWLRSHSALGGRPAGPGPPAAVAVVRLDFWM
jgi:transposase InsO family protein